MVLPVRAVACTGNFFVFTTSSFSRHRCCTRCRSRRGRCLPPKTSGRVRWTMPQGDYTSAALAKKAADSAEYWEMVQRARDYGRGHGIGARAVVSTMLFPGVSHNVVHNALNNKIKKIVSGRYATAVLTEAVLSNASRHGSRRKKRTRRRRRRFAQHSTSAHPCASVASCPARRRCSSCARRAATLRSVCAARVRAWRLGSPCC